jgi:hypothetical protein
MSHLRNQVDEIGRRIWPDPPAALRGMHARRRRWWLGLFQPRRPQLGMRWLPVLAAVATVAIFVALAGGRPAVERTQGQGRPAVRHTPLPSGALDARANQVPEPGRAVTVPPPSHAVSEAPPAATPAPAVPAGGSSASAARPPSGGGVVTVTLTEADAGRTITVAPGTRIVVTLQGAAHRQWSAPRTLDPRVVTAGDSGRDAGGGAHGTFVAAHSGYTRLVAGQGGCHGPLCLIASASTWQVHIVVG